MYQQSLHIFLLLTMFLWQGNSYGIIDDSFMKLMIAEEEGSGSGNGVEFDSFARLLTNLKNTDLLVMVDTCASGSEFLDKLKGISKEALQCMKQFTEENNSVAVMTFSSKTSLVINFDEHKCLESNECLFNRSKQIQEVREKRNLKKALRTAQKLLSKRREKNARKQLILLITFGIDQIKDESPTNKRNTYISGKLAKKFGSDNVTLAVVGVGNEAIRNQQFFKKTLEPQTDEYLLLSNDDLILEVLQVSVKFMGCLSPYHKYGGGSFGKFRFFKK